MAKKFLAMRNERPGRDPLIHIFLLLPIEMNAIPARMSMIAAINGRSSSTPYIPLLYWIIKNTVNEAMDKPLKMLITPPAMNNIARDLDLVFREARYPAT